MVSTEYSLVCRLSLYSVHTYLYIYICTPYKHVHICWSSGSLEDMNVAFLVFSCTMYLAFEDAGRRGYVGTSFVVRANGLQS